MSFLVHKRLQIDIWTLAGMILTAMAVGFYSGAGTILYVKEVMAVQSLERETPIVFNTGNKWGEGGE